MAPLLVRDQRLLPLILTQLGQDNASRTLCSFPVPPLTVPAFYHNTTYLCLLSFARQSLVFLSPSASLVQRPFITNCDNIYCLNSNLRFHAHNDNQSI